MVHGTVQCLSFAKRLTIGEQSAIIIVLVSEFGRVPNTVIRVFTVSFTYLGEWHFFCFRANLIIGHKASSLIEVAGFCHISRRVIPSKKERSMNYAKTMSGQLSQHIWHL